MYKVTVVTINFNNKEGLLGTLLSVINQTYELEFIIIDGGSTDGSFDIINQYSHRIDKVVSEKDNGLYDAMNKGINLANGEWLIFMNSGDEFYSSNILQEIFNSAINFDSAKCIIGNTLLVSNNSKRVQKAKLNSMRFIHQSVLYRKELHYKYGLYAVDKLITASDYFFISKIISNENVVILDSIISKYSIGGISDNIRTNVQVLFYDYLSNRISYYNLILILMVTPIVKFFLRIKNHLN